jgi:hypothetical protein
VKVGDLVRGSISNIRPQRESVALIVGQDTNGQFSIVWISGVIKRNKILHNFDAEELEVISEGW